MADDLVAGRYRLLEPLGRGSMSSVWEAHDEELARRVAVKLLSPSADRQRFDREARAAAALSHQNIVALYDYGQADGRPYMVLECLAGGSLDDRLEPGTPLPDDETRRIAADVAAGLAHAHARGLVHRDLKPANILFDAEGRAKIADFGIARMRGTGTLTEAGTVLGTASTISPEQAAGESAGPQSDVYSFGVILFRMLTGRLPFVAANAMDLVRMHRDDPPPEVAEVRPDAPAPLAALADAALRKAPEERPADGAALAAALRDEDTAVTVVAAPVVARAAAPTRAVAGPRRRGRVPVLVAAAVAIALLLGGGALAIVLTGNGGGGTSPPASLSLPTVPTTIRGTTTAPIAPSTTLAATTAPTTTAHTTTAPTTTAHTTTTAPTTSTAPTTTAAQTTTAATTTAPTTTAVTTTDTTPTTTSAPPATTTGP